MRDINNNQDILDSRDVIARRDELAEERQQLDAGSPEEREWDAENAEELAALEAFIQDGSAEWDHGVTLVRETYFEDYAQELAEELGVVPAKYTWPTSCIDWEHAARELRYDYTGADFDGVTYYYQG